MTERPRPGEAASAGAAYDADSGEGADATADDAIDTESVRRRGGGSGHRGRMRLGSDVGNEAVDDDAAGDGTASDVRDTDAACRRACGRRCGTGWFGHADTVLAAERLADLQRLQAEYVNYKRRVDRDRALVQERAVRDVLESVLPVLDDIQAARDHGDLIEGPFAAIADKLEATLGKYGLERFGAKGEQFDPMQHEALMHAPWPAGDASCPAGPRRRRSSRCCSPATVRVSRCCGRPGSPWPTPTDARRRPARPGAPAPTHRRPRHREEAPMASQDWFEKDFYAILGVPQDADAATIKKAYRRLARKHHPDQNAGDTAAERRFKDIGEAHSVLSDPKQRRSTTPSARWLTVGPASGPVARAARGGFEDVFSAFGAGAGGPRVRFSTGGPGGRRRPARPRRPPRPDVRWRSGCLAWAGPTRSPGSGRRGAPGPEPTSRPGPP